MVTIQATGLSVYFVVNSWRNETTTTTNNERGSREKNTNCTRTRVELETRNADLGWVATRLPALHVLIDRGPSESTVKPVQTKWFNVMIYFQRHNIILSKGLGKVQFIFSEEMSNASSWLQKSARNPSKLPYMQQVWKCQDGSFFRWRRRLDIFRSSWKRFRFGRWRIQSSDFQWGIWLIVARRRTPL